MTQEQQSIATLPAQRDQQPPRLRSLDLAEMEQLLQAAGFARFRAKQLFHWVYRKGVRSFDEMKNLPGDLRDWLAANTLLGGVKEILSQKQSADGSFKFLFGLDDGKKVESVLMPDPKRNYWTQCLSSQVGCAVDCKFCVTGFNGFFRHLRPDEIVDQVLLGRRVLLENQPEAIYRNLVYMGMGEPLLNTDAVIKSIRLVTDQQSIDLSPRRITVSTSGIVPGMVQMADANTGACLALSLNASSQEQRVGIMPISKKYPLEDVMEVLRTRQFGRKKLVTFEYVLLSGVNDTLEDARRLVKLCRGVRCKINLIPFNPSPLLPFGRPERAHVDAFAQILLDAQYTVSVRWSKALDVDGACGQLAGDQRRQRQAPPLPVSDTTQAAQHALGDLDFFATVAPSAEEDDDEED